MLQHIPVDYMKYLHDILNRIFLSSKLPSEWKDKLIIPILKPGKDPSRPQSYRPIALQSCVSKLLEKIICNRLSLIYCTY